MSWIERARANLLRSSKGRELEDESFAEVMREWEMTTGYNDLEEPVGICELCEHPEIRHQFEVRNRFTQITLWVGSKCIEKFVPLYRDDIEVTNANEKAKLVATITTRLIDQARRKRAECLLEKLSVVDNRFSDSHWLRNWKRGYSVRQLQMIAVAAKRADEKFSAFDFRINTRRHTVLEQAKELQPWQYRQLRLAFTGKRQRELDNYFDNPEF